MKTTKRTASQADATGEQQLAGFIERFDSKNAALIRSVRKVLCKRLPGMGRRVDRSGSQRQQGRGQYWPNVTDKYQRQQWSGSHPYCMALACSLPGSMVRDGGGPIRCLCGHRRPWSRAWLRGCDGWAGDRKSTRLNSSHQIISYAVFCLKKKNNYNI